MFKVKKKSLISLAVSCVILIVFASLTLKIQGPFLFVLKSPLTIFRLVQREISAIVFFHRNFIQNDLLKKEVGLLRNELNLQKELVLENSRLKEILALKEKSQFRLIVSQVIGRSPDAWSSSIIIDKGRANGIRAGMTAVSYLGLAGKVISVQESTSKILLISDPNLAISAIVQRSRQEGSVSGTLGAYLIMRYLNEESDIKAGDLVVTSGLNSKYPKGLAVGTVIDTGKEFSGLGRFAIIKPAVKLSDIEEVLLIVP